MADWGNFYTLLGTVAGTLIGLLFVVITFSSDRKIEGDEHRVRFFVTPLLVYFATLLLLSLALAAPIEDRFRALTLGILGCAGLAYVTNLAMTSRRRNDVQDHEVVWDVVLPITAYILIAVAATAWALSATFADAIAAIAAVVLLIAAIRKSWLVTLSIAGRRKRK
jgi:F0F1-type ATP synthase assembly protein I